MYDDILIPYDGSDESEKSAEHGIELAAAVGATVHALYVIDLPGAPRTVYVRDDEEQLREEYRTYGEDVTGELCQKATDRGVDCVAELRTGSVHEEIVDFADEEGMDLVVMGTAYRGKFGAIMGGKADRVVRASKVPVTTVRMLIDE